MSNPKRPTVFIAVQILAGISFLCPVPGSDTVFAADKPPDIRVATTVGTASGGPVVTITGNIVFRYTAYADVADDTTFDLTGLAFVPRADHPTDTAFSVGDQPVPPKKLQIVGGTIHGTIPLEWGWTLTHAFGGAGYYTVSTGLQILEGARIHNMHDAWRPRETPSFKRRAYPNTGSFLMRGCYVTGIRDDAIENDEFMPGDVEDCLFDGIWTFLSEQNEGPNGVRQLRIATIAPDEDPNIRITRSLVRLAVTCPEETRRGTWFKLHGYESPNHHIVMTDCVFAADGPRRRWNELNFPKNSSFEGKNLLLWFGAPGTYGAKIPAGLTLIEGQAAKDKWHQLRNEWLDKHGYDVRSAEDWNPMEAPVAAPRPRQSK